MVLPVTDHPVASGITGLISRSFGVHPLIAAAGKYVLVLAVAFGAYKYWENTVSDSAVKDVVIEQQGATIENQEQAGEDQAEDQASKDTHVTTTVERETDTHDRLIARQSDRIAKLERDNDELKKAADANPCLRVPWDYGLQRRGGFDLNRIGQNAGGETDRDWGGDKDEADVSGSKGSDPRR